MLNAIRSNDAPAIAENLAAFKVRNVAQPLEVIRAIPITSRLPALAEIYGRRQVAAVINVALTTCFEKMNVKAEMNGDQIVELAEMLIDASEEDFFAMEDLMLFMQGMLKGDYGTLYNRMDIPTFFEMFERYRQRRHEEFKHYEEEQAVQHKIAGSSDRSSDDRKKEIEAVRVASIDYYKEKWSKTQ